MSVYAEHDELLSADGAAIELLQDAASLLQQVSGLHSKMDVLIAGQERMMETMTVSFDAADGHGGGRAYSSSALSRQDSAANRKTDCGTDIIAMATSAVEPSFSRKHRATGLKFPSFDTTLASASQLGESSSLLSAMQGQAVPPAEAPHRRIGNQLKMREAFSTDVSHSLAHFVEGSQQGKRLVAGKMRIPVMDRHSSKMMDANVSVSPSDRDSMPTRRRWRDCWLLTHFPYSPGCKLVLVFDIVGMVLLCHDSCMIPFILAWNQKTQGYFFYYAWASVLFWTVDLVLHFATGYTDEDDRVVKNFKRIACRYLARWFLVDFTVVAFDWLNLGITLTATGEGSGEGPVYLKLIRLLKATRMLRIYAMLKAGKVAAVQEMVMSKAHGCGLGTIVGFCANISKLVFIILWLNHIGACTWVALVSNQQSDTGQSWERYTAINYHTGTSFEEAGLSQAFIYFFAYYWSITTMFSGASFLVPMTTLETAFSCVYVLFGILFASSMISSMSAMLMDSHEAQREKTLKIQKLQLFLQQHNVDPMLSVMIQRQALERMSVERRIAEEDVSVISLLSAELRTQLRFHLCAPVLSKLSLWRTCDYVDDQVIKNLCRVAVHEITCDPGQILFDAGKHMEQSYILIWGEMHYTPRSARTTVRAADGQSFCAEDAATFSTATTQHGRRSMGEPKLSLVASNKSNVAARTKSMFSGLSSQSSRASDLLSLGKLDGEADMMHKTQTTKIISVYSGQQVCEIALWAEWVSVGLLEAVSACELLECSAQGVIEVLGTSNVHAQSIMRGYASAMVSGLEKAKVSSQSDLNPAIDHDSIVALMPQEARFLMSLPALEVMKQRKRAFGGIKAKDYLDLEEEVCSGKCNLGQDVDGRILRVVQVVALRIQRPDGLVCVQIGKIDDAEAAASVQLPGTKMRMQEGPMECTNRLLLEKLPKLSGVVSVDHWQAHTEEKQSQSSAYSIPTRYVRTVVEASMDSSTQFFTKKLEWAHGPVEGFAFRDQDKPGRRDILAWMTQESFEFLKRHQDESEGLVIDWIKLIRDEDSMHETFFANEGDRSQAVWGADGDIDEADEAPWDITATTIQANGLADVKGSI